MKIWTISTDRDGEAPQTTVHVTQDDATSHFARMVAASWDSMFGTDNPEHPWPGNASTAYQALCETVGFFDQIIMSEHDISAHPELRDANAATEMAEDKAQNEPQTFTFMLGIDVRAYGNVEVSACTLEEARAQITHDFIADNFVPFGTSQDHLDRECPRNVGILEWSNEDGEEGDLDDYLPDPAEPAVPLSLNMLSAGETIVEVARRERAMGIDIRWSRDVGAEGDRETEDCAPGDADRATIYLMTDLGEAIAVHDVDPSPYDAAETGRIVAEAFRAIAITADTQTPPPSCHNCGQHLKDGSGICIDCGADLEGME